MRTIVFLLALAVAAAPARAQGADQARQREAARRRDAAFANRILINASRELNRARSAVANKPTPAQLTQFAQAQDALETARQNQRKGDLVGARQFADRCILLSLQIQAASVNREDLRRRLERALREIDRLADGAPPVATDPLRAHLARVDRKARQAREAYLKNKLDDSLALLREAEEMLTEAREGTFKPPVTSLTPKQLEEKKRATVQLEEARKALQRATDTLGQVPPPLAGRTLVSARQYADRAQGFFQARKFDSAAANARLAVRLANRSTELGK